MTFVDFRATSVYSRLSTITLDRPSTFRYTPEIRPDSISSATVIKFKFQQLGSHIQSMPIIDAQKGLDFH